MSGPAESENVALASPMPSPHIVNKQPSVAETESEKRMNPADFPYQAFAFSRAHTIVPLHTFPGCTECTHSTPFAGRAATSSVGLRKSPLEDVLRIIQPTIHTTHTIRNLFYTHIYTRKTFKVIKRRPVAYSCVPLCRAPALSPEPWHLDATWGKFKVSSALTPLPLMIIQVSDIPGVAFPPASAFALSNALLRTPIK